MADEQNVTAPTILDGGDPTDQEALLAAQVDTIGDNPTEEPAAAVAATAAGAVIEPTAEEAAASAAAEQAATEAAAAAKAATEQAAVAETVTAVVPARPAPTPTRDFDADLAENQRKFDDGEIDGAEFQKEFRTISKEEAGFTARMEIWAEQQQTAAEMRLQNFNTVAATWERQNAGFMDNPLRAQQMQAAIVAVNAKSPGLSPAKLFEQAAKAAFEYCNWKVPEPVAVDTEKAKAEALAGRQPAGVPPTLAGSPAAAPIEAAANTSAFASLDAKDISTLEDAVARMTRDQQDAYLRESPGSNSPATNR